MSKFKWKDLLQLNSDTDSYLSPLSCMAHVDVNAFFAQSEQIRCGYAKDDPVVCVQWQSIIAVSYGARKYGISRMDSIEDAMKKSNNKLIPVHTAVFKRGEDHWQYHDGCGPWHKEKDKQIPAYLYKVSLDPYRRESRKIYKIFQKYCKRIEKASIDEVFIDLGNLCFERLMFSADTDFVYENLPGVMELRRIFENGNYDLNSELPLVPAELKSLEFKGVVYNPGNKPLIEDWDDVIFAIGSNIIQYIRERIEKALGYTTSAGIASTKYMTKLGSNFKKPDAQTIILNKNIETFLDKEPFDITSFWTFGGKIGKEICILLKTPEQRSIKYIRDSWPDDPSQLHKYLDDRIHDLANTGEITSLDTSKTKALAQKLFDISRGKFLLPLTEKPVVKSMMSNKNMRSNSCCNFLQAISWIEVFAGELAARIKELEQEHSKVLIPRTATLMATTMKKEIYRKSGHLVHSHSEINPNDFLKIGTKLMQDIDTENTDFKNSKFYPLLNLSLTITSFDIFDMNKSVIDMFGRQVQVLGKGYDSVKGTGAKKDVQQSIKAFYCESCEINFESNIEFQEHSDLHVAQKLSESMNGVTEDSKNLSIGEKRLLFNKRKRSSPIVQSKGNKKSRNKTSSNPGILSYFSK